jgi:hypothetical protein
VLKVKFQKEGFTDGCLTQLVIPCARNSISYDKSTTSGQDTSSDSLSGVQQLGDNEVVLFG